jgi:hypothetical protein
VLVCGSHHEAIRANGLTIESADIARRSTRVVSHPRDISFTADDVVLFAMKSRTMAALDDLRRGVERSRSCACRTASPTSGWRCGASRTFRAPARCCRRHLEPGVVQAHSTPVTGILDTGGTRAVSTPSRRKWWRRFAARRYRARPDIMRWKYSLV